MHACIALIKKLLVKSCYIWRRISLLLKVVPKCLMVLHRVEKKQLWIKQSSALALFYDFHFYSYQADTSLKSWPFDFWGGDGGYGWFEEKISLRLAFRENKFLQGNTWRKKFLHWQKYLSRRVKLEKNSITRGLGEKYFLPKPNHPYPSQKSNGRSLRC